MEAGLDLAHLAAGLSQLLAAPALYLSPACRELRTAVHALHALQSERAFGGRGAGGAGAAAAAAAARTAALRAAHQRRDNDRRVLAGCALREGRAAHLARLAALPGDAPAPVLDGAVETAGEGSSASSGALTADAAAAADAAAPAGAAPELFNTRSCYICHARYRQLHHFYDSLCPSCAELNWAKRHATADLHGRIALVTGARVKIGFHVALKLLRCGARVLATSRFPRDTAARFAAQPDFAQWRERLEVFGLDFRDLGALEAFCAALVATLPRLDILINNACQTVRRPAAYYAHLMRVELAPLAGVPPEHARLLQWNGALEAERASSSSSCSLPMGSSTSAAAGASVPGLAAAQGLLEAGSSSGGGGGGAPAVPAQELLAAAGAQAQAETLALLPGAQAARGSAALSQVALAREDGLAAADAAALLPEGHLDINAQQLDLRRHNSWTMLAEEIETPELAEVMAINAMAPFILCARLKGLMARGSAAAGSSSDGGGGGSSRSRGAAAAAAGASAHGARPPPPGLPAHACRFIVNVSSMEGKFYFYKLPTHPHTNMAKAALNMLTRTTAAQYAQAHAIFMTAVDTGWINEELPRARAADKAARSGFATPLDEVDAAARILDPVLAPLAEAAAAAAAAGEGGAGLCRPLFGAFLKDYAAGEW